MDSDSLICITCPKGCSLSITREGETVVEAKGGCARGFEYAKREIADPRRMVASTVRIQGALHPLLPVYTSAPIPKAKIRLLLDELRMLQVNAPVRMGDVLLQDALGTGVDVIASRDMG
jgi:CxxC motif-containing protein